MKDRLSRIKWNVAGPLALLAAALLAVGWFSFGPDSDADAEPAAYLGEIGTPVRGTFIPSTPTPQGITSVATPRPRPTFAGVREDTPEERDAQRRADLLVLLDGYQRYRDDEGEFPSTGGNVQSLCVYKDLDVGCLVRDVLGQDPPADPLGSGSENGYWYESNGEAFRVYAVVEGEIPEDEICETDYEELAEREYLICVGVGEP